jgi:DnaJ-class molecular chaperone
MITHIVETKCRTCKGTGRLSILTTGPTGMITYDHNCSDCNGTGWEVTGRMIEVDKTIPYGEAVSKVVDKVGSGVAVDNVAKVTDIPVDNLGKIKTDAKKTIITNFAKSDEKKVR